jgi:hypothetical protein
VTAVCAVCEEPLTDTAVICHGDARRLAFALRDVPELARELDVTITKRSKVAHRPGPKPAEVELDPVKLEFDLRASAALEQLRVSLRGWVDNLADDAGLTVGLEHTTLAAHARYLSSRMSIIRTKDWAPDLYHEVMDAIRAATRAIDAPPELAFMGHCPTVTDNGGVCGAELWAKTGATSGWCRTCGADVDLEDLRGRLIAQAKHVKAPAAVIARALTAQGQPLNAMRLFQWRRRGHIAPVAKDPRTGQDLYLLGDVADVLERMERKVKPGVIGKKGAK